MCAFGCFRSFGIWIWGISSERTVAQTIHLADITNASTINWTIKFVQEKNLLCSVKISPLLGARRTTVCGTPPNFKQFRQLKIDRHRLKIKI